MNRIDACAERNDFAPLSSLPIVDVVMPVYNGEAFLEEQVDSILAQSDVVVRLIVVDDASTDGSLALLKRMASQDPRLEVLHNPTNLGLMRSLSLLLRQVRGQFFALADQDDIWDRDKLSQSISTLRARDAVLVYSDVRLIDKDGLLLKDRYLGPMGIRPIEGRDPLPFIFRNPAIGHTMVGTADLARAVGEIDPRLFAHEVWIVAAACRLGDVAFLNAQLGSYRQHTSNVIGAQKNALHRFARLFGPKGTLWRRQQTRIRAISALVPFYPSLVPIAGSQARTGVHRLMGLPSFTLFMLRLAPMIGLFPALIEIMLYSFGGTPPNRDGPLVRVTPG